MRLHAFSATGLVASLAVAIFVLLSGFVNVKRRPNGIVLAVLVVAIVFECLAATTFLASQPSWTFLGPTLLFVGLLTPLNAAFDWISLGLTRALLRRGLELGGWWFLVLAIFDAIAASVIILFLALTLVLFVQAFDDVAFYINGNRILPIDTTALKIALDPTASEFWWIYILMFSTMIPSLLNLVIGGASLARGIPLLASLLLRRMPANRAVPTFDRPWIALILTMQIFGGGALGFAMEGLLAYGVIGFAMPRVGLDILMIAQRVADLDLPSQMYEVGRTSVLVGTRVLIPTQTDPNVFMRTVVLVPEGDGPFPLVVMNHGATQDPVWRRYFPTLEFEGAAHWFVEQGFVVAAPQRSGYGRTGGAFREDQANCLTSDFLNAGRATAADIQSAIDYMTNQPFVRKDDVVVVGQSGGGWGTLALANLNLPMVKLAVVFGAQRGGHFDGKPNNSCKSDNLISAAATLGAGTRVPILMIYTQNDSFIGPDLSKCLYNAWVAAGGNAEYKLLPPFNKDGHFLVDYPDAVSTWSPIVTQFMKKHRGVSTEASLK